MFPPKWIVFDAVGTLMTPVPSVAEAYAAVGRRYDVELPVETVRQRFRQAFRDSESLGSNSKQRGQTSEADEITRWQWIVGQVLPEARDPEACFRDLWDHFAAPRHWQCYDDVAQTLAELTRRGIGVAIASNFDQRLQGVCAGLPELAGLSRLFVSSSLGVRKPEPDFYHAVRANLNVAADDLLMIGDDPECDVAGPRQCGWRARSLQRDMPPTSESWSSLHELPKWLDQFTDG